LIKNYNSRASKWCVFHCCSLNTDEMTAFWKCSTANPWRDLLKFKTGHCRCGSELWRTIFFNVQPSKQKSLPRICRFGGYQWKTWQSEQWTKCDSRSASYFVSFMIEVHQNASSQMTFLALMVALHFHSLDYWNMM